MRVSIIIPYYRAYDSLEKLLTALDKQVVPFNLKNDIEVIIVNDDLDNPLKIDKYYSKINFRIINKTNGGVASARNCGIKSASGEIILFLDQDCCPDENWLVSMINKFDNSKQIAAIGGKILPIPQIGIVNEYFNTINRLGKPIIDKKSGKVITIITANSGFKLQILKSIEGFNEKAFFKCSGGEDVDLSFRLRQAGYMLIYEPSAIVHHEYPTKFRMIFSKFAHYGRGMRIHCTINKIKPQSIKQPNHDLIGFLFYATKIFLLPIISPRKYIKYKGFWKSIVFTYFDIIRYIAHGFGFFFPNAVNLAQKIEK